MATRLKVDKSFYQFAERLQEIGHDADQVTIDYLESLSKEVTSELQHGINRHRFTGETASALIVQPKVERTSGGKYSVKVGFQMPKGLPAAYVNKGTKTNKKDPFITRALNKSRLKKRQTEYMNRLFNQGGAS